MIAFLKGKLCYFQSETLIIEVGGIGFKVAGCFSSSYSSSLPPLGEEITIYTYLYVREEEIQLFGFLNASQLQVFQQLLTVPGIGPKVALNIVSSIGAEDLAKAIIAENLPVLTNLPGVGKKTAQRLIIELKDKILKGKAPQMHYSQHDAGGRAISGYYDAIEALLSLGYNSQEVAPYLIAARKELGEQAEVGQLVKFVLKKIGTT